MSNTVTQINEQFNVYEGWSDEQLQENTAKFKQRIADGEHVDNLLVEAFATVKSACRRLCGSTIHITGKELEWNMVPYDVQLVGGIVLHEGNIAEMMTGEGKTLVAVAPLYLNALTGRNCQLVTVNDYLARRDSEWVGSVHTWLGLTVGCLQNELAPDERREQYACDITYGTNSEFGFDYLRDMGMATDKAELVQRDYYYAIVDEIDSILIDEARTPLIISGPVEVSTHMYDKFKILVGDLYKKQRSMCNELANEAKAVLEDLDNEMDQEKIDDAIEKLFMVKLGMPKHKQFIRLMQEPAIRRMIEARERVVHSDQNRGMLQGLKNTLYFSIDERQNDADISDLGRQTMRPDDPESFILPDLSNTFKKIELDRTLNDEEKRDKRTEAQEEFDELSEGIHNISQLLKAYCLYEKDKEYIVIDGKVIIVDEHTGRPMPGRRFSDGLHQALEAKENVEIERETRTLARVTIQNYFRMYDKLAGMTGTAMTEASEFHDIYKLNVVEIPTNRPCKRNDNHDVIFKTKRDKYNAIADEVRECNERGQPVLLGTVSVEDSEVLGKMLKRQKIDHTILNAKYHQAEADIVENAGQKGAVTIATNMAGRGTDIVLGDTVEALGGLHVIGSARHDSRRIDRQLRGRCARQGDNGSSRFYISLEDDLMRIFGGDKITRLLERFGFEDGEEISGGLLTRTIENAQRRVEQEHYGHRKRTLQYDDVMNKQREVIYGHRKECLLSDSPRHFLMDHIYNAICDQIEANLQSINEHGYPFNRKELLDWFQIVFSPCGFTDKDLDLADPDNFKVEDLADRISEKVEDDYVKLYTGHEDDFIAWL